MKQGQVLSHNSNRKKTARDFWLKVAGDFNEGIVPEDIARKYQNPKTGKEYTVKHIYWILRNLNIGLSQ